LNFSKDYFIKDQELACTIKTFSNNCENRFDKIKKIINNKNWFYLNDPNVAFE